MRLFELADKHGEAIRSAGRSAIAELRAKGVAAHYLDDTVGSGIIEEQPDGRRYSVDLKAPTAPLVPETTQQR